MITAWWSKVNKNGYIWGLKWTVLIVYYLLGRSLPAPVGIAEDHVYDREWDVLIVLDACRDDLMRRVSDDYDWFEYVGSMWSIGSTSEEWISKTFDDSVSPDVSRSSYITGNPHTDFVLDDSHLEHLDEVWKYAWDEDAGTIRPRPITDRAISYMRSADTERVVVHYMQPHFPTLFDSPMDAKIEPDETGQVRSETVWDRLEDGRLDADTVWECYEENLRCVLDDVQLLIENIDAERVAITADHGNSFGEYGFYGHDGYLPLDGVRVVPWCVTTACDESTYDPDTATGDDEVNLESRLSDLGYLD